MRGSFYAYFWYELRICGLSLLHDFGCTPSRFGGNVWSQRGCVYFLLRLLKCGGCLLNAFGLSKSTKVACFVPYAYVWWSDWAICFVDTELFCYIGMKPASSMARGKSREFSGPNPDPGLICAGSAVPISLRTSLSSRREGVQFPIHSVSSAVWVHWTRRV